jgi:hypothetical protein
MRDTLSSYLEDVSDFVEMIIEDNFSESLSSGRIYIICKPAAL